MLITPSHNCRWVVGIKNKSSRKWLVIVCSEAVQTQRTGYNIPYEASLRSVKERAVILLCSSYIISIKVMRWHRMIWVGLKCVGTCYVAGLGGGRSTLPNVFTCTERAQQ